MAKSVFKNYPVAKLLSEIDQFITTGQTTPGVLLDAFRKLEAYPYRNPNQSPRYFTIEDLITDAGGNFQADQHAKKVAEMDAAFKAAKKAFDLVSKSADAKPIASIDAARNLQQTLSKLTLSQIWLTPEEYDRIASGDYQGIDLRYLTDDAQTTRSHVDKAIAVTKRYGDTGQYTMGVKFSAHYDPTLLAEVEAALALDTTAKMLLEHARSKHLPIIFATYDADKAALEKGPKLGMGYMATEVEPGHRTFYFITAFTNLISQAAVHAITIAHELRHFRFKSLISNAELDGLEPQDYIISSLLDEADAQAVFRKVAWSLRNKKQPVGIYDNAATELARFFDRALYRELPLPRRLQRATQDCFAAFIYKELNQPAYLKTYVASLVERGQHPTTWMRKTGESNLLADAFLTHLSKVTENVSYLDAEGMKVIREMITEKLPSVVERLEKEAILARGKKPEPS